MKNSTQHNFSIRLLVLAIMSPCLVLFAEIPKSKNPSVNLLDSRFDDFEKEKDVLLKIIKSLDFGDCFPGIEKKMSFEIHCTNPVLLEKLVDGIQFQFPGVFRFEVIENEHEKRNFQDGFEYHYHRNKIEVTFVGSVNVEREGGGKKDLMSIALRNGEQHQVSVLWNVNKNE